MIGDRTFERRKELFDDGGRLHQPAGWWSKGVFCGDRTATAIGISFPDLILTFAWTHSRDGRRVDEFAEVPGDAGTVTAVDGVV